MPYVGRLEDEYILKTFIKKGGKVVLKCNSKRSPLHYATCCGRFKSCLEILQVENFRNLKDLQHCIQQLLINIQILLGF